MEHFLIAKSSRRVGVWHIPSGHPTREEAEAAGDEYRAQGFAEETDTFYGTLAEVDLECDRRFHDGR